MKNRIIFLKERLGFIIDHIDLFLEDYNRLTTSYFIPKDIKSNHFDFNLISSVNPIVWEKFKIDSQNFQVSSNTTVNLSGLVKNKEYIVPPFIEKDRLEAFFVKLTNYKYILEVDANGDEKLERIVGELNSNQINLLIRLDNGSMLVPIEQLCNMIINFKDYNIVDNLISTVHYSSKIELEVKILELMIKETNKIGV